MASIKLGSSSKKSKACMINSPRDRLSELPDEILVHILSFLPILDAVRTVLISRFGNLWTLVSTLKFKEDEFSKLKNLPSGMNRAIVSGKRIHQFSRFVRDVLMLHKGIPIDSFELDLYNLFYECDKDHESLITDIKVWMRFAIGRGVKKLKFRFEFSVYEVNILPSCIFTSQSLVELELENCKIQLLSRVQMVSLRKLSLAHVMVCNKMFEKIISGCPCLQELVLRYVHGVDKVIFTAPNIEKLDISSYGLYELDCPNVKILNIHLDSKFGVYLQGFNIPSVHEVLIHYVKRFGEFVNKICNVEVVKFSEEAFQEATLTELHTLQTRWKCLHIESRLDEDQLIRICRVLRSSPHLEELIVFSTSQIYMQQRMIITTDHHMLPEELSSPCETPQLKSVTIRGHKVPCQGLLRLAEFLLRSCVNLEKMVILPSTYKLVLPEDLKFVEQICCFPRASTNARVICGPNIY